MKLNHEWKLLLSCPGVSVTPHIKDVLHRAIAFMFNGGSLCGSTIHPIDTKLCVVYLNGLYDIRVQY